MVALVYDGLTQFDPDGKVLPALADRWTVSRRVSRYVFHLRAGVSFQDATRVTRPAVRQSFLRVLAPGTRGGRAGPLFPTAGPWAYAAARASDVPGTQLRGDSGIAFDLAEPLAIFPKFLAMPVAAVVPAPLSPQADLGQHPVGTGPWRFVAWQHDDYLVFARNPDYWGGTPAADTLTVRIIPEPLTRAAEFEAGRLSVMEVPFGETVRWRQQHPALLLEKPALRVVYVALNNRRGPLQNPKVRQAINYAVNVPEVLATVYGGRGILARGAIPPGLAASDTARPGYRYDPALAKRLLAAAGFSSGMALQLWRNATNVELSRVAQAVQAQLEPVGIKIELVERDASSQREAARKGETDMVVLDWWADYPDGDNFLYPLFYSRSLGPRGKHAFYRHRAGDF